MVRALAHRNYRLFFAGQGVPASWCSSRRATRSSRRSCARRCAAASWRCLHPGRGRVQPPAPAPARAGRAGLSDAAALRDAVGTL